MKSLLVVVSSLTVIAGVGSQHHHHHHPQHHTDHHQQDTMATFLSNKPSQESVQWLEDQDKKLLGKLLKAAQENGLTDRAGVDSVLGLLKHLSRFDATKFALAQEGWQHGQNQHQHQHHYQHDDDDKQIKRKSTEDHDQMWTDFHGFLHNLQQNHQQTLSAEAHATLTGLMGAIDCRNVTQFVHEAGYVCILELLHALDDEEVHEFTWYLEKVLEQHDHRPQQEIPIGR